MGRRRSAPYEFNRMFSYKFLRCKRLGFSDGTKSAPTAIIPRSRFKETFCKNITSEKFIKLTTTKTKPVPNIGTGFADL